VGVIETERLLLRRWLPRDREPFAAMNADPAVMDFPRPLTRAESDAEMAGFEARWEADGFAWAAAERRSDGAFVGMVGIARCELDAPFCPCVEVGWRLPKGQWGQGYATEAARAWARYGFAELGLEEIVAFTDPGHGASLAVMRKIGMRPDPARDFEHPEMPAGHPLRPQVLWAVGRAEWARTMPLDGGPESASVAARSGKPGGG
jgi:RimJ/RimL family protein N-acetyltransferase